VGVEIPAFAGIEMLKPLPAQACVLLYYIPGTRGTRAQASWAVRPDEIQLRVK